MDKDISPEERLLRLIKFKSKKEDKLSYQAEKKMPQPESKPEKKIGPAEEKLTWLSKTLPQFKNIIIINRLLFFLFIILMIYFLIDYFFLPSVKISPVLIEEPGIEESIKEEPVRHSHSYYEKEIMGKDLFKPLLKDIPVAEQEIEVELEDIIVNLNLLGVVSGDNPQAIIEDRKKRKTYFLNKGESLGELKLKEILEAEGKVILIYKGREFDLGL